MGVLVSGPMNVGDFNAAAVVYLTFSTTGTTGAPLTLAGTPAVSVYKDGNTTETTTGVTLTVDYDSVTGLHHVAIDTTDSFYAVGSSFQVVITTGTVGGTSVVGHVIGFFSIERKPKVNVTQISSAAVNTGTAQIGCNAVQAGGTVWGSGAITANSIASDAITAAKIATGAIDADAIADGAIDAAAFAAGAITATVIADGAIDAATFAAGAITATVIATGAVDADALATDAVTEIVDAVWANAARTLTAIDEDSTTLDLDATVRAAVGLASANLDTQLDALPTAAEITTAVWAAAARTLTALDEDSTTIDLDATIIAAVGLASSNLDTQLAAIAADNPNRLTKNTALSAFMFVMYDSADHITPKTGLTITAQRTLDGAALASCANSASEVGNGIYKINLAATDTNADSIMFRFTASNADPCFVYATTQPT